MNAPVAAGRAAPPGFEAFFEAVRERRAAGVREIRRLFGPARLALAAAWAVTGERPLVLFLPRDADLLPAADDLDTLLRAFGVVLPVLRLPGAAVNPYLGVAPHAEVLALRAEALAALAAGGDSEGGDEGEGGTPLVLASAAGALARTAAPERLAAARLRLRRGGRTSPAVLAEHLAAAGYRNENPVSSPGDFARRGGILDLFPVDRELPVRVEFAFDEVEDLREFEVETQRSGDHLARPEALTAPPAWEWIGASLPAAGEAHPAFTRPGTETCRSGLPDYLEGADLLVADPARFREAAAEETLRVVEARASVGRRATPGCAPPEALLLPEESLWERLDREPPAGAVRLPGLETPESPEEAKAADPLGELPAREVDSHLHRAAQLFETLRRPAPAGSAVLVFVPGEGAAARFAARAAEAGAAVRDGKQADGGASRPAGRPGDRLGDRPGESPPPVFVHPGRLSGGFEIPLLGLRVVSGAALMGAPPRRRRRPSGTRTFLSDFRDLKPGDPVVHTEHGIGRFLRVTRLESGADAPELVEIGYAKGARLFVPVDRLDLIERYRAGGENEPPPLDRLGGSGWARRRQRVAKALRDIADELIRLYAARREVEGHAFPADPPGLAEFEDGFEWTETEDQARAIREVFADMESPAPMDRLLAGDVGFGKTEVALRAAFKAAMDGKQVALLAPTTVLAAQHARLFAERFRPFPLRVELLSRFRTPKQQREVAAGLRSGVVDIVIGTHRLLSKDVEFRDLGLLVVDEEQRFGVAAKERLKRLANRVDHLAMTATPIPRTLNMSLAGIRDLSVIETPPRDRMAIQTQVLPFDPTRIREAVRHELAREGQVYFVHNRIASLGAMQKLLADLVPEARVLVAHGQMRENALEKTILRFQEREADLLLSTTIIENGLDLPRVNTLVVNRAETFGLSQLYQIRGRVGRSSRRAYAYLLVPPGAPLPERAEPRLRALREFSDLGAGFRIAALDLELRGAGNLLGAAQHGHLEAVGFDLYHRLLEEAVADARGAPRRNRCALNLRFQLRIPREYLEDERQRMWLYKRCSSAASGEDLDRLAAEARDRFGPAPTELELLFEHVRLRLKAESLGYAAVHREAGALRLQAGTEPDAAGGFRVPLPAKAGPAAVLESLSGALSAVESARGGTGAPASAPEAPDETPAPERATA